MEIAHKALLVKMTISAREAKRRDRRLASAAHSQYKTAENRVEGRKLLIDSSTLESIHTVAGNVYREHRALTGAVA